MLAMWDAFKLPPPLRGAGSNRGTEEAGGWPLLPGGGRQGQEATAPGHAGQRAYMDHGGSSPTRPTVETWRNMCGPSYSWARLRQGPSATALAQEGLVPWLWCRETWGGSPPPPLSTPAGLGLPGQSSPGPFLDIRLLEVLGRWTSARRPWLRQEGTLPGKGSPQTFPPAEEEQASSVHGSTTGPVCLLPVLVQGASPHGHSLKTGRRALPGSRAFLARWHRFQNPS